MPEPKLKPCPFCGKLPYLIYDVHNGIFEIGCNNRRCKVIVYTNEINEKQKAIAAWNKRTEEKPTTFNDLRTFSEMREDWRDEA